MVEKGRRQSTWLLLICLFPFLLINSIGNAAYSGEAGQEKIEDEAADNADEINEMFGPDNNNNNQQGGNFRQSQNYKNGDDYRSVPSLPLKQTTGSQYDYKNNDNWNINGEQRQVQRPSDNNQSQSPDTELQAPDAGHSNYKADSEKKRDNNEDDLVNNNNDNYPPPPPQKHSNPSAHNSLPTYQNDENNTPGRTAGAKESVDRRSSNQPRRITIGYHQPNMSQNDERQGSYQDQLEKQQAADASDYRKQMRTKISLQKTVTSAGGALKQPEADLNAGGNEYDETKKGYYRTDEMNGLSQKPSLNQQDPTDKLQDKERKTPFSNNQSQKPSSSNNDSFDPTKTGSQNRDKTGDSNKFGAPNTFNNGNDAQGNAVSGSSPDGKPLNLNKQESLSGNDEIKNRRLNGTQISTPRPTVHHDLGAVDESVASAKIKGDALIHKYPAKLKNGSLVNPNLVTIPVRNNTSNTNVVDKEAGTVDVGVGNEGKGVESLPITGPLPKPQLAVTTKTPLEPTPKQQGGPKYVNPADSDSSNLAPATSSKNQKTSKIPSLSVTPAGIVQSETTLEPHQQQLDDRTGAAGNDLQSTQVNTKNETDHNSTLISEENVENESSPAEKRRNTTTTNQSLSTGENEAKEGVLPEQNTSLKPTNVVDSTSNAAVGEGNDRKAETELWQKKMPSPVTPPVVILTTTTTTTTSTTIGGTDRIIGLTTEDTVDQINLDNHLIALSTPPASDDEPNTSEVDEPTDIIKNHGGKSPSKGDDGGAAVGNGDKDEFEAEATTKANNKDIPWNDYQQEKLNPAPDRSNHGMPFDDPSTSGRGGPNGFGVPPASVYRPVIQSQNSHFLTYLMSIGIMVAIIYVLYHNKQKVLGLIIEGRMGGAGSGGRGGVSRRPGSGRSNAKYTLLEMEDADDSRLKGGEKRTNVIY